MARLFELCVFFGAVNYLCLARHISVDGSLSKSTADNLAEAASFLTKFGYLNPTGSEGDSKSQPLVSLSSSIAAFQEFTGLNVTGELDQPTLSKMQEPRCGVKDILGPSYRSRRRRRRYVLQGSRWRVRDLRYKILSWPTYADDKERVREIIRQSFEIWAKHSALTFTEVPPGQNAQIEIRFESGEHGDGDPFDGVGGTLAHAFFPLYGGDAHFDDDERWMLSMSGTKGTNLFMTASHEFGHSLGLSHSHYDSLMSPYYQRPPLDGSTNVMTEDDIIGIQALYGPPEVNPVSTDAPVTPKPKPPTANSHDSDNILCNDPEVSVDAMFMAGSQSQTYVFKGSNYWRLTSSGVADGYPRRINDSWDQIPDNIDAAFSWLPKERIYFFKGDQYWRMTKFVLDSGYPKLIRDGFRGVPDNIDAVLRWTGNGKLYFFKDTQYWKYDSSRSVPVSHRYPQPISNWRGVPGGLDATLTYSNGHSYFFKKGYYFRFNDAEFKVDDATPPYPRPTGTWWFGCKNQRLSATAPSRSIHSPVPTSFNGDAAMGFGDLQIENRSGVAAFPVNTALIYLWPLLFTVLMYFN